LKVPTHFQIIQLAEVDLREVKIVGTEKVKFWDVTLLAAEERS
jgi:hypothetical protein